MNNLRKKFLFLFLFIFFVFGSIISLKVGISHDEYHEEENWKYNLNLSKKIYNDLFSFENNELILTDYKDKYYGIGFQIVSQPTNIF